MKNCLVSYSTEEFRKRQKELEKSALKHGIDKVFSYTEEMLKETDFYKKNKDILINKRGAGYWVWKPYVILMAMDEISKGDILFYVDAGVEVIGDVNLLAELCVKNDGILLFNAVNKNKHWTKRDCFKGMGADWYRFWEAPQAMGGYQVYQKSDKALDFIKEYLRYVQVKHFVDDSPSVTANLDGFIEHRHDQSILSILAIKYNIKLYRNPSQGGNHLKKEELRVKGEILNQQYSDKPDLNSDYPQIFFNKRDASDFKIFLIKLRNKLRWLI